MAGDAAPCAVEGCGRPAGPSRGLCRGHYQRFKEHGDVRADVPLRRYQPRGGTICTVPGCGNKAKGRGLCMAHYVRLRRTGDARPDVPIHDEERRAAEADPDRSWWTHEEIGQALGLSRARIRQIEASALRKLRAALDARRLTLQDFV